MNYKKTRNYIFSFGLLCFAGITSCMNVKTLYDTLVLPEKKECKRFQFYGIGQTGFSTTSYDECGRVDSALRIWNNNQNAIKMLEGFCPESNIGQLRTRLDANDDGTRGHFCVNGCLDVDFAGEFGFFYLFREEFSVSLHLPVYSMKLKNVVWNDLTHDVSADDLRVKEYLTNNFVKNVKDLGCLDLCGWNRSGVGDLAFFFGWRRNFEQEKKLLENVKLSARAGLTLPTGKKACEDQILAFPFGNDGAIGVVVGGGLDLTFGEHLRAGLDVQLMHVFGNTRCRRIKTDLCQTDLLFLQKTDTFKEFGLTQRFNLYAELYRVFTGLSLKLGYQFKRKSEDTVYTCSNAFSNDIANTAESLQEWTMHNLVFNLYYDACSDECGDHRVCPTFGIFAKVPFNGMRAAMVRTVGFSLGIDF